MLNDPRDKPFNCLLNRAEHEMLTALSRNAGTSKGTTIRQALTARYNMEFLSTPTCANSRPCLIPHMHPPSKPASADQGAAAHPYPPPVTHSPSPTYPQPIQPGETTNAK